MADPRRPERRPERPWVMRTIVVLAAVVVLGGVVWASMLGHLF
ncbi:hypothetical protein QDR37_13460 [Amnibacterium sp. CER49]|nr:hypothetical protein [Amnibacterium sp. CER49]MDH2444955.1 hypothetical protein [Amnibacterium sp. CER49]